MMRTLLILAAIIGFSASAFAQTAAPKVGGKPLKRVKPPATLPFPRQELSGSRRGETGPSTFSVREAAFARKR
jgi:hypothetical protein